MTTLITTAEAAKRLNVSQTTLHRMLAAGQIAAYQLPTGTLRFDQHELDQWLEKCRIGVSTTQN